VRFDLPLIEALKINLKGTQRLSQMAIGMKALKAFVYVSTAFSQSYQLDLEEKHYETPYNVHDLLSMIDRNDLAGVEEVEKL